MDGAGLAGGEMREEVSMGSGVSMHAMTRNVPPHTPCFSTENTT
jgi:hypothetical protein